MPAPLWCKLKLTRIPVTLRANLTQPQPWSQDP